MACLCVLIPSSKCYTIEWKCSNLSFGFKAAILKLSQKLKGLSRTLHVLLNKNTRSVKMENLINLRGVKQKYSFSQRVFENWSYFPVSIIIQTSYKHQLLKITVRIPPGLPKNPRENKESFWLTKKITAGGVPLCVGKCVHGSSLVMVSKMCFKGLSIFYLTGMFQVPAVHWWTWRQGPWLLTCLQGAVWLQDYLISLLRDSKKQYKP